MARSAGTIELYRGTSCPFSYAHKDVNGVAVPLTNKTVYFTMKAESFDSDATDAGANVKKTVVSSGHTDAAAGLTSWVLTDADTYLEPKKYYFSVVIEDETTGLSEPPSLVGVIKIVGHPTNRQVGNEL